MSQTNRPIKKKIIKKKKKSFFFRFLFLFFLWCFLGAGLVVLWYAHDLPSLNRLSTKTRKPSVVFQSESGFTLATYGDFFSNMILMKDLPNYVPQALLAAEDRRFYYHFGIDIVGLVRAAYNNYQAKRVVQGGSTITQQLAKNFLITQGKFCVDDRSIKRKIQEALLAFWIEWKFTKEQILTLYLNRVYLGANTYGIEAAAQRYFNKSSRQLSVFESALIAGLLKAPSRYCPAFHPKRSVERARIVLNLMVEEGFIPDAKPYLEEGIKNSIFYNKESKQTLGYRYFCDWIYEQLPNYTDLNQDLVVVVTLDEKTQDHAQNVCEKTMNEMGKKFKTTQISLVALEPDGAVRAMVGGLDYIKNKFNHAVSAKRQPGSAFKPMVYMAALEEGIELDDMIEDTPFAFSEVTGRGKIRNWAPKNYKYTPKGEASVFEGFIKSVNGITLRLAQRVGIKKVIEVAKRLGITNNLSNHLSLALGTLEVDLLELTTAIATFSNQGHAVWPYGIQEIRNSDGKIIYKRKNQKKSLVVSSSVLESMRKLLRGVVQEGTGRVANIAKSVAGKTGSNANRDAWFVGYRDFAPTEEGITNIAVGVWTGNDDNSPMHPTSVGGRLPTTVAALFLKGTPHSISVDDRKENIAIKNFINPHVKEKTLNDVLALN